MTDNNIAITHDQSVTDLDVCILHDQFRVMGGAERVACEMARALDAPIYAARVTDGVPPDDVDVTEVFSGRAKWAMRQHYLIQDAAQMLAWQHVEEAHGHDVVLINKTNPLWYMPPDDRNTAVIGYCHSTPRGMYDQYAVNGGGLLTRAIKTGMKALYESNRITPDAWACNSEVVKRRMDLYWDRQRDVSVIYPPVKVSEFAAENAATADYYLAFGRLRGHKRFDEVIRAFQDTDRQLVIGGDGPHRAALEQLAAGHENIQLVGYMASDEKARRLAEAKALIANHESEDFGITPIEAYAAGTPVLGVNEGFTRMQIRDGKSGIVFPRGVEYLRGAIDRFEAEGVSSSPADLEAFAQQFSVPRFHKELLEWVTQAYQRARDYQTPDWDVAPGEQRESEPAPEPVVVADGDGS